MRKRVQHGHNEYAVFIVDDAQRYVTTLGLIGDRFNRSQHKEVSPAQHKEASAKGVLWAGDLAYDDVQLRRALDVVGARIEIAERNKIYREQAPGIRPMVNLITEAYRLRAG